MIGTYGMWTRAGLAAAFALGAAAFQPVAEAHPQPQAQASGVSVYAPYSPLIGEWTIAGANGAQVGVSRFSWGPGNSYIWFATALVDNGREVPHFEGILVWNGVNRNLDLLLSIDLVGGRAQESGTLSIAPDGTFVRDHVATYSASATRPATRETFRQTFRFEGPDRIVTGVLRQTATGWAPTFPGSDRLVMTRRTAAAGQRPG
jgi:hypothetical protein